MVARALAVVLVLTSLPAPAFELKQDSTGSSIRWPGRAEFVVDQSADALLGEERVFAAVRAAVSEVDAAAGGLAVTLRAGPTGGVGYDFSAGAANQSEIVVIGSEWPFDKAAIAVTVVTVNTHTHEILDADIALNAAARAFKVLDAKEAGKGRHDDIQNTLTHELGHALGLAHNPSDPKVVMYPMANAGEINKRVLSKDDVEGLSHLYPGGEAAVPADPESQVGCAAAGGRAAWWIALLAAPLLGLRRRALSRGTLLAAALALPAAAVASGPTRAEARVREASVVATGEVTSTRTLLPEKGARLLVTEVEVAVRRCLKGRCPATLIVRTPGGRIGDLEQTVDGLTVPRAGELVAVTVGPVPKALATGDSALYRLSDPRDFTAFAAGSKSPQPPPSTPPPSR